MEKKDRLAKILVIFGTVLVWIPTLAPVFFGFTTLFIRGIYRFDFLMPAELGILVFIGGALLLWGAIRAGERKSLITWGLGIAAGSIAILMAFGDVVPGSLEWAIVIGLLVTYSLAIGLTGYWGSCTLEGFV